MKVYKIRRKTDGLFLQVKPGGYKYFNKIGRQWRTLGHLIQTLGYLYDVDMLVDCEIVVFELVETSTQEIDFSRLL